jgi:gluconokinase
MRDQQRPSIVFMGVSGCGKSSLAAAVARELQLPLVEGDDYHSAASLAKMAGGIALTDVDRAAWLSELAALLRGHQVSGIALTCSALRRAYREQLRAAAPGLRFVFLDLPFALALERVRARGASHFFSPALVRNQYDTLERPDGEAGVLRVDAALASEEQVSAVADWVGEQAARD